MKIEFKNTYEVSVMSTGGGDYEFYLVDYDTFEEFEDILKVNRIKWNKKDGEFSRGLNVVISEKDYGAIADWCHPELETYMQNKFSNKWVEDNDSTFFAPGLELEEVFNHLKQIDGVELKLEVEVEPGDYINKYEGPDHYGKAWSKIQKVINSKQKSQVKPLTNHIKDTINDYKPKYAGDYIDWEAVVNTLNK